MTCELEALLSQATAAWSLGHFPGPSLLSLCYVCTHDVIGMPSASSQAWLPLNVLSVTLQAETSGSAGSATDRSSFTFMQPQCVSSYFSSAPASALGAHTVL